MTAGVVRWFDGTGWTEHTRPVEPAAFAVPGGATRPVSPPMTVAPTTFTPAPFASVGSAAYSPAPEQAAPFGGQASASAQAPFAGQAASGGQAAFGGQAASAGQAAFGGQAAFVGQAALGRDAAFGAQPSFGGQPAFGGPAAFGGQPSFGGPAATTPRFDGFGQQPTGFGGMPGPSYPGTVLDHAGITSARRRVLRDFWFGVGFLLFGALVATWAAASISASGGYGGGRHYVSTAGVIGGLTSFYRARRNYKAMVELGGQPWSSASLNLAVIGGAVATLLSVAAIVHAYTATGSPSMEPVGAGSCWAGGGGSVWQVSCDLPHSYVGTALITDGGVCPSANDTTVALNDGSGSALCLTVDNASTPG